MVMNWYKLCCVSTMVCIVGTVEQKDESCINRAKEEVDGQYGGRTHGLGVISTTL